MASVMLDEVASLTHQSLVASLFHHLAHALHEIFSENRFHLCRVFASCLPSSYPDPFHAQDRRVHLVDEHWLILHGAD